MYRFTWMGRNWQGIEIDDSLLREVDNILEFVTSGEPVLLIQDLDELEDLGIDKDEVIIYE